MFAQATALGAEVTALCPQHKQSNVVFDTLTQEQPVAVFLTLPKLNET